MSAELAAIAADPSIIERAADPGVFVMEACERGKTWLRQALDLGDIDQIAEIKSTAEAIRIYTISKNYSEDAKVSATELVRRAEGGLGRATRKGQEDDWIRGKGENNRSDLIRNPDIDDTRVPNRVEPGKYVGYGQARVDTYAMVDGVSEEAFEEVIAEAKAEGNLSRANVARKARARADGRAWADGRPFPAPPNDDGRGRPRRGRSSRRPLSDFAEETGWQLRKDVEKLERIFADDRYSYNKQQVAAHLRGHLQYAVQVCQDLLDRIGTVESQRESTGANENQHDTGD